MRRWQTTLDTKPLADLSKDELIELVQTLNEGIRTMRPMLELNNQRIVDLQRQLEQNRTLDQHYQKMEDLRRLLKHASWQE
ncbi:MAG: hypothetical protein AAGJ74_13470 [Pseudomonadota bacterium]